MCNAFYMKGASLTTDLRPIIGTMHGTVNDRSHVLRCKVKSDIERTLLYYEADKAVVRLNHVAPKQLAHAKVGGLAASGIRTIEASEEAAAELCRRWPQWVTRKPMFERGHAEVKLKA